MTPIAAQTYESAVAEFNAKKDAEEKAIWDEHRNAHCPSGQHVWEGSYVPGIRKCLVCDVREDRCGPACSCLHCGPVNYDPKERRANELRKFLWDGQKAGTIAAPAEPKALMSFLWRRSK